MLRLKPDEVTRKMCEKFLTLPVGVVSLVRTQVNAAMHRCGKDGK